MEKSLPHVQTGLPADSATITTKSKSVFAKEYLITKICDAPCGIYMSRVPGVQAKATETAPEVQKVVSKPAGKVSVTSKSSTATHAPDNLRLRQEVAKAASTGIKIILCLLSRKELKGEGVDLDEYKKVAEANGILFVHYEIKSMKAPVDSPAELRKKIIEPIASGLGQKPVLTHCKNGIGRAGTMTACIMLHLEQYTSCKQVILHLRTVRSPKCVQSGEQEEFVFAYAKMLGK